MAVASAHRIARDDNRDSAAEALPFEGLFILAHELFLRSSARRISIERPSIRGRARRPQGTAAVHLCAAWPAHVEVSIPL